jgi:hypothetical protein
VQYHVVQSHDLKLVNFIRYIFAANPIFNI